MAPVRQSARQRARSAALGRLPRVTASPLVPTARFTPAAATGVAQQQLTALDAAVADLRREMTEIREMLQSVRPAMAAPSAEVATDPPAPIPGPASSNLQRAGMVDPPWPTVAVR